MLVRALPAVLVPPNPDFAPNPSKTMDSASDSNFSNGTCFGAVGVGLWCSKQTYTSLRWFLMLGWSCIEPPCTHSCVRLAAAAEIDRSWARTGWPKHWSQGPRSGPRQGLHPERSEGSGSQSMISIAKVTCFTLFSMTKHISIIINSRKNFVTTRTVQTPSILQSCRLIYSRFFSRDILNGKEVITLTQAATPRLPNFLWISVS